MSLRLESDFVTRFMAGIRVGVYALEDRITESLVDRNQWLDATPFLREFPALRLAADWRLMCIYTSYPDERFSSLLAVRGTPDSAVPPIPEELEQATFWSSYAPRPELPPNVTWDVLSLLRDDGTDLALFERSMLVRWIDQTLNTGHAVWWPRTIVVTQWTESFRSKVEDARAETYGGLQLPIVDDLRPQIVHRVGTLAEPEWLPIWDEQHSLVIGHEFGLVEFYSHTEYGGNRFMRHRDWYVDRQLVYAETRDVVSWGGGYII